jgi:riboflavin transporter FmnP
MLFRIFYFSGGSKMKEKMSTRYMAAVAMFAALSFVSVLIAKVIPNVAGFLSYEPKDAVIVIAGLLYGPLTSVLISVIVSLIEMLTISSTGPYGFLMNVISTCAFAVPAAWYYQKHKTQKDAVIGLCLGVITMVVAMLLWNYIITPFYMGVSRETVAGMLMSVFLPFNLVKGGINAGLTLLLYKPVVVALRKAGLAQPSSTGSDKRVFNPGFTLFAVAVLVTFVLLFLTMIHVL